MGVDFSSFALIQDGEGRFLLVRRPDLGLWNLPGGKTEESDFRSHIDFTEACLLREVAEETGLRVSVVGQVGLYLTETVKGGGQSVSATFLCTVIGGDLKLNEEAEEFGWFGASELPDSLLAPHRVMVEDFGVWRATLAQRGLFASRDVRGMVPIQQA